ncbi:monovalent cation/H(+) antiporter subunit G [Ilumatobacter sp.]|uniref:monovalent cation/H(+) antiporter subunit G n=1 Tax=Ilumatobacter sp. TaxID=1967498 RepID=UPI003B52C03E
MTTARDLLAGALLLAGAGLFVVAAIGLHRFTDVYGRMHAATKPATLGVVLTLAAAALRVESPAAVGKLVLIACFQLATVPAAAHLIGRAAYRGGITTDISADIDDLAEYEAQRRAQRPSVGGGGEDGPGSTAR